VYQSWSGSCQVFAETFKKLKMMNLHTLIFALVKQKLKNFVSRLYIVTFYYDLNACLGFLFIICMKLTQNIYYVIDKFKQNVH
jgi:hypothetical protein